MGYYKAEIEVLLDAEGLYDATDVFAYILYLIKKNSNIEDANIIDWEYSETTSGFQDTFEGEDLDNVLEKGLHLKDCFSLLEYDRNSGLEAQVRQHDLKVVYAALATAEFLQSSDQSQRLKDTIELYLKAQSFRLNRSGYSEETEALVTKTIAISSQLLKNWVSRDEESRDPDLAVLALRTAEMLMQRASDAHNKNAIDNE